MRLQKYIPPEQGLKRIGCTRAIQDHIDFRSTFHQNKDWNRCPGKAPPYLRTSEVHSTRTRIETIQMIPQVVDRRAFFRSTFHQNKDWNTQNGGASFSVAEILQKYIPPEQGLKHIIGHSHLAPKRPIFRSTFHQNKDWNLGHGEYERWVETSEVHSTRTRIET